MRQPPSTKQYEDKLIQRAGMISLVVSVLLMLAKFWAYRLTRSQAVFSDAIESIVNVLAAGIALLAVHLAYRPADQDHPYGHGKIEFFSAAFEGGLIAFASILVCARAVEALVYGRAVEHLGLGIAITLGAGLCNAGLGFFLLRTGKRGKSSTLEASGQHVLSDFWTSIGIGVALFAVRLTGWNWLDPFAALLVGALLAYTGVRLVRESIGGLLDEENIEILQNLLKLLDKVRPSGIIQVHHARIIRSGRFHHIDAHAVVPQFWDVSEAHSRTQEFEDELMRDYPNEGELYLHIDPCRRAYCRSCDYKDCPIRVEGFEKRRELSIAEFTNPEEPGA